MFLITPVYNVIATVVCFLFSWLPVKLQLQILVNRDAYISSIYLVIANYFLPPLTLPNPQLRGKTAIVTGANSGIGLQIATDLARQNATVYLACRNLERGRKALGIIHWRVPTSIGNVFVMELDTSSLDSVRRFAERWASMHNDQDNKRIDFLVHNAGITGPPPSPSPSPPPSPSPSSSSSSSPVDEAFLTKDGLEITYATNFLGGFLLTYFLEPYLAPDARVVLTSSTGSYVARFSDSFATGPVRGVVEKGFHAAVNEYWGGTVTINRAFMPIYGNTKGMQVVFARLLQERFDRMSAAASSMTSTADTDGDGDIKEKRETSPKKTRRIVHAFTPGLTSTPIFAKTELPWFLGWVGSDRLRELIASVAVDAEQGAATGSWLCMTDDESVVGPSNGGRFWDRKARHYGVADVLGRQKMERLWKRWEKDAGVEWR